MFNAKSLLDSVIGQVNQATGGQIGVQSADDLGQKAKELWGGQSTLGKGAIAGGLMGILMTKGGRRMLGTGARVGGAALIGGLAYKAWQDWKDGKAVTTEPGPVALPQPGDTRFLPTDAAQANDLSARLLQAMVAAAKADGHVTADERARIDGQLAALGLEAEASALIAAELDAPLDAGRIAALARTEEEAAEIYAASLLVVDADGAAEKGYLAMLAARLQLDAGLVAHLHAKAEALV
ncbi:MAG: tellurite resistance TerB family protein [Paracoccaceae bacterium]